MVCPRFELDLVMKRPLNKPTDIPWGGNQGVVEKEEVSFS